MTSSSLRRDKVCPQCEHRKLWHVERVQLGANQPLPVALEIRFAGVSRALGRFEAFICARCGNTELYALALEELKEDPAAGVHFIDAEPKAGLR